MEKAEKKKTFVDRIKNIYPDRFGEILISLEKSRKETFRVNVNKANEEEVLKSLVTTDRGLSE